VRAKRGLGCCQLGRIFAGSALARLAETQGPASVGEIVDELYAVERAVASLLGAIALAADPDINALDAGGASSAESSPAARAVTDWTTTGVLS
jgi:hypothetical protein